MNYKNIVHKNLILGAVFLSLVAVVATPVAFAENDNGTNKVEKKAVQFEKKLEKFEDQLEHAWQYNDGRRAVTMQADGSFRVSGVVVKSVNADGKKITVEFFGFTREVSVAEARFIGGGQTITLADVKEGDNLTARGRFDAAAKIIHVKEVHDLSYNARRSGDIQARIQELLEMIRQLQERIKNLRQ